MVVRTESITIPTYELGQEDPNPSFATGYREIYPYPLQDDLTDHRVDKAWKAAILENRYLKVIVLPELGGHVYSVYDKSFKREVLYRNHVVKYGLVGLRGAWVSGGIEFNFPNGHTVTSVSPVDFALRKNSDGSASIFVGDHEKVSRMHWFVALTLYPDRSYLEQEVFLYNRTSIPNRYWFWANAAVPAAEDMQYVYPMTSAYPHARFPVFTFPIHEGKDLSWWKNVEGPLSLFARASKRDFFGAYYHEKDVGVVHVADFQEVPGKKTWTWGTAPSGRIWDTLLSDHDGPYAEIQSGRFETQLDYEFLEPRYADTWKEYWYPVNHIGSFVSASKEVAVNLEFLPNKDNPTQLLIAANPTRPIDDLLITISSGSSEFFRKKVSASPDHPYSERIETPKPARQEKNLTLELADSQGRKLIRFSTAEPLDGNSRPPAIPKEPPAGGNSNTVEGIYLQGVLLEKQGEDGKARALYAKALELDPGHSRAHVALGILLYKAGELDKAHEEIETGLRRNPNDDMAHYYHALYHRDHGDLDLAKDNFWRLIRSGPYASVGYYGLGEIAMLERNFSEATEQLNKAATMNPLDEKAQDLWAIASRKLKRYREAKAQIEKVLHFDPLDYLGLYENYLIQQELKNTEAASQAQKRLLELYQRDDEIFLEVYQDYQNVGLIQESMGVLRLALEQPRKATAHPLLHYNLGYCLDLLGKSDEARKEFDRAKQCNRDYVFPHRLETLAVLRSALKYNPQDDKALYYMGNLLYSKKRYAEATGAWDASAKLNPSFSVVQRNLGYSSWKEDQDLQKAIDYYEKAITASNTDYRLYRDLDELYSLTQQQEKRIALLDRAPNSVKQVQDITLAQAELEVDRGNYQKALDLLMSRSFKPWEGGQAIRDVYVNANIGLGDDALARREYSAAIQAYGALLKYPQNLGVGSPARVQEAQVQYLISEVYAAQGQSSKAKELLEKAAKGKNELAEESYYQALALKKLGRDDEAALLLDQLISGLHNRGEETPSGGILMFLAGLGQEGKGNIKEARLNFEKALKLDPTLWRSRRQLEKLQR